MKSEIIRTGMTGMICLILFGLGLVGCIEPPQPAPNAPPAPPKPKVSSYVVLMVKTARNGTDATGSDIAVLRFFMGCWLVENAPNCYKGLPTLTPQDVDYLVDHVYTPAIRSFIAQAYYANHTQPLVPPVYPVQLEDPK